MTRSRLTGETAKQPLKSRWDRRKAKAAASDPKRQEQMKRHGFRMPSEGATLRLMGPTGPIVFISRDSAGLKVEVKHPEIGTVMEIGAAELDTLRSFVTFVARAIWGAELAAEAEIPNYESPELEPEPVPCPHCHRRPDLPCCEPRDEYSRKEYRQHIDDLRGIRIERAQVVDQAEAAKILGVTKSTLKAWRSKGTGPPYLFLHKRGQGGRIRYRLIDLERMICGELVDPTTGERFSDLYGEKIPDAVKMGVSRDDFVYSPFPSIQTENESE